MPYSCGKHVAAASTLQGSCSRPQGLLGRTEQAPAKLSDLEGKVLAHHTKLYVRLGDHPLDILVHEFQDGRQQRQEDGQHNTRQNGCDETAQDADLQSTANTEATAKASCARQASARRRHVF